MLSFLRKIRHSLIESNSTRKYLLYAIGEILLVMIGILLALQVNNWNENKKLKANEIKIYKEIVDDLEECKEDIEVDLEDYRKLWDATIFVRNHMAERKPLNDSLILSLDQINWDQQFYPKKSAFESLQSIGLYTLSNDSVRLAITDLYQLGYGRLVVRGREGDAYRIDKMIRPYLNKHMTLVKDPENTRGAALDYKRRIVNYEAFLNDQQMLEAIQEILRLRSFKIRSFRGNLRMTDRVLKMVRDEVIRLEG